MSTVGDVASRTGDSEESAARDPFAGGHIEVDESQMRVVSPSAWLGGVKRWLDGAATRLTYSGRD